MAVEAMQYLTTTTEQAIAATDDPEEAFVQLGRAYLQVAIDHPGHCAIAFRGDLVDVGDPDYEHWGRRAYGVLYATVARLLDDDDLAERFCRILTTGMVAGS